MAVDPEFIAKKLVFWNFVVNSKQVDTYISYKEFSAFIIRDNGFVFMPIYCDNLLDHDKANFVPLIQVNGIVSYPLSCRVSPISPYR